MIVGVSVVMNIIGLLLTPTKMILGYPLSQFCFEQLCPVLYTIQWSIFSLIYELQHHHGANVGHQTAYGVVHYPR